MKDRQHYFIRACGESPREALYDYARKIDDLSLNGRVVIFRNAIDVSEDKDFETGKTITKIISRFSVLDRDNIISLAEEMK